MTTRTRSLQLAEPPARTTGDGRTVRVRVVAWNHTADVTDDGGRTWYREQFARGGLKPGPGALVAWGPTRTGDHDGGPVGRIVATEDLEDGLYADVRVADTTAGRDLLGLVDDELVSVSAEFDDDEDPAAPGELVTRSNAELAGVAFTHRPQHPSAAVLGRRSFPTTPPPPLETTVTDLDLTTTDELEQLDDDTTTDETATERSRALPAGARRPDPSLRPVPGARRSASRFRSLGEFVHAAAAGRIDLEERGRYYRALAAGDFSDITGLSRDQWINEIIDLIRPYSPTIDLLSSRPLPDKGEVIQQPTVTTRPTTARQAEEGDAVSSTAVVISPVSWTVETYGGGQAMSLQSMLRSEPSYLDEVIRLYMVEMTRKRETDVVAGLFAAADDVNTTVIELPNTAKNYQDAFIDADDVILGQIDRGAEFALINRKMRVLLGKALDDVGRPLFSDLTPNNNQGTFAIPSGEGEVRRLRWVCAPKMDNTVAAAVVGVPEAYRTMTSAVGTLQADVPETLQHQHAVYQFMAHGKVDARGLVKITNAA